MAYQQWSEERPLSRGERWTYIVFLSLLVGMLAGETFTNYKPVKLSILFFLLTWFPLLALHELGHALAARMCGWHVSTISLGMGRVVGSWRLGATLLVLRVIPLEGYVSPQPRDLRNVRLKSAFIYFAGCGMELLVIALFMVIIGPRALVTRTNNIPIILMQTFSVAVLLSVVSNWIPRAAQHSLHGEWSANDGLGMIRSFTRPMAYFEAQVRD